MSDELTDLVFLAIFALPLPLVGGFFEVEEEVDERRPYEFFFLVEVDACCCCC